jgi:hypothetical protein
MAKQLFLDDNAPAGYTLVRTLRQRSGDGVEGTYARLYKVAPFVTANAP